MLRRSPVPVAHPTEPIARHLAPSPPCAETTFRRRRLATLAGLLAVVLAVAPFVGGGDDAVPVTTAAAGPMTVRAASVGSPTAVRELLSETTSTLVAATGATTTSTSTTSTTSSTSSTSTSAAPTTSTTAPATTTSAAPATTEAPSTTAAPTTTVHRHPTTTAAPATTQPPATTTTTAPPRTTSADSGGYAYDDPRSTQVWYDLAQCESGGNWSIDSGNGYYGGLQFSLGTWESVGGSGYPHEHPAETQIEMGRRLQAQQGWGAWPHCSEELGLR